MSATMKPPDSILRDLALYFEEDEVVQKSIASASGILGGLGELWVVLTNKSVFFHTREYGKEPIVALLRRQDIKNIVYSQGKLGYTLIFTPKASPQNITTVSFPKSQREILEDLCEDLADFIEFRMEGVSPTELSQKEPPITTVAVVANSHANISAPFSAGESARTENSAVEPPESGGASKIEHNLNLRIAKSNFESDAVEKTNKSVKNVKLAEYAGLGFKKSFLATIAALIVGYLWYKLFAIISERS